MRYVLQLLACILVAVMLGGLGGGLLYVDGGGMTWLASFFMIALALFLVWMGVRYKGGQQEGKS